MAGVERVEIGPHVLYCGDCREILPTLSGIDAVVTDPPYPEIDRDYGRLTEPEWASLMDSVVLETRRMVGTIGSGVFILQPNSERVGRLRPWLWDFMAKWSREWNMPQDAWWWNFATPPTVHCHEKNGLMRPSMKACVWLGDAGCRRNQSAVLLKASEATLSDSRINRHELGYSPSGLSMRHGRALSRVRDRGGATPFNVIVCANSDASDGGGAHGHGASTPLLLVEWWTLYLSAPGGVVMDPFMGSGTTGLAAISAGRRFVGIEQMPQHFETACRRIERAIDDERNRLPFAAPEPADVQPALFD